MSRWIRLASGGIATALVVLAACAEGPSTDRPAPAPVPAISAVVASVRALRPAEQPAAFSGPDLVRPEWDGVFRSPAPTSVLAYPVDWRGELDVRHLALIGDRLYTAADRLYSVPLATGSAWVPVPGATMRGLSAMLSDGQRLYLGDRRGAVVGLDPARGPGVELASLGSAITGLALDGARLLVATAQDGVWRCPLDRSPATRLEAGSVREVSALAVVDGTIYTLTGGQLWVWPRDGGAPRAVPGSRGATTMGAHRGVLYLGCADGWVLRCRPGSEAMQALMQPTHSAISALGSDGAWLYAASGNTTYMQEQAHFKASLCHPGFAGSVGLLVVIDGARVLVGTERGLFWMPR